MRASATRRRRPRSANQPGSTALVGFAPNSLPEVDPMCTASLVFPGSKTFM